jgi:LCP family protein required for cell wall assembly
MHDEIVIHQDELDRPERRSSGADPLGPRRVAGRSILGRSDRYDAKSQPLWKRLNWRKALKFFVAFVGLAILAAIIFVLVNVFKVSANPFGFGHLKGEDQGRVNIMLMGVGDPGHDGENLSDTNMVISVNTRDHQLAITSIPRDLRVKIPGYGYGKINNANAQGGIKTAKQVYENTLGIPINYYVKANFSGLKDVVDAVGGVDIDNADTLYDPEYPCDKNEYRSCGFKLKPGHYHMDGATALKYVRCRKGTCGDDFGRANRQQQVMAAIRQKATGKGTLANPIALGKLVSAAGDNIDTDLSINNMMRLNELTKDIPQDKVVHVVFSLQPDGFLVSSNSSSDLLPEGGDFDKIQDFEQNIFKYGPIWMEHPTVVIQNGTSTPGIAAKFEQKLGDDGYDVTVNSVANALTRDHSTTQIIDYTGGKRPNTVGYLQDVLKVQASQPEQPLKNPPADIVVVLGSDYASTVSGSSNSTSASSGGSAD